MPPTYCHGVFRQLHLYDGYRHSFVHASSIRRGRFTQRKSASARVAFPTLSVISPLNSNELPGSRLFASFNEQVDLRKPNEGNAIPFSLVVARHRESKLDAPKTNRDLQ